MQQADKSLGRGKSCSCHKFPEELWSALVADCFSAHASKCWMELRDREFIPCPVTHSFSTFHRSNVEHAKLEAAFQTVRAEDEVISSQGKKKSTRPMLVRAIWRTYKKEVQLLLSLPFHFVVWDVRAHILEHGSDSPSSACS
jgi:hypothetical protein